MQTTPVSLNIDKTGMQSYKDAMNSSYVSSYFPQVESNISRNFTNEFQKVSNEETNSFNLKSEEYNSEVSLNNRDKDYSNYTRNSRNTSEKSDKESPRGLTEERTIDRDAKETNTSKSPKENNKSNDNEINDKKEALEKSQNQNSESGKIEKQTKESDGNGQQSIKEIIEKNQIQQLKIMSAKEEVKDNFGEVKKIDSTTQAEKILLKDSEINAGEAKANTEQKSIKEKLTDNKAEQLEKNSEIKSSDEKVNENSNSEKKQSQEHQSEKKESNPLITNDLKIQNKETNKDSININFVDDLSKNLKQVTNIQVNKTYTQTNLFDQYQAMQEKLTNSVENSIKMLISSGESKATIQLHPPELGRLQVELITRENQITAKINTENIAVKEVILSNLNQLKSNLENAGTQITSFNVEVGGFKNQFEQNNSNSETKGKRRGNGGSYFSSQENDELKPNEVKNYSALTVYLGRSINCLI